MKIGYYPGCSLHSTGVEYDLSARAVAGALGVELEEIRNWVCCGSSPAHSTDELVSLALPAFNLSILKEENGLNEVCVPCASCYSRLKCAQVKADDGNIREEIERVIERRFPDGVNVLHMLDLVVSRVGLDAVRARVVHNLKGMKVACYYGCLMTRPPKTTGKAEYENPMEMDDLVEALGAKAVDWNLKTYCCGASFALTQTQVVLELTKRILEDAVSAGAEAMAVGCPLCHSNLDSRQDQINARSGTRFSIPVFYFTELMGLAFGEKASNLGIGRHLTDSGAFLNERGFS